jgi:hypothetical protein
MDTSATTTSTTTSTATTKASIDQAISKILQSNFDADSKVCFQTLIKLIDNLLQHPNSHPKMRSIRLQNAAIDTKVVQKGGVDLLLACGFVRQTPSPASEGLLSTDKVAAVEEYLVLSETAEDTETLVTARKMLTHVALHQLHIPPNDLPKFFPPKPKLKHAPPPSAESNFNVYQGQRYDGQSASVGTNLGPPAHWKSSTATKLEVLQKQQEKLERKLQKQQTDRQWVASRPNDTTSSVAIAMIISPDIDESHLR